MQTLRFSKSATLAFGLSYKAVFLATITLALAHFGPLAVADPGHAQECTKVGGAFITNFIANDQTAGTATGDLKGSLGVKLLGILSGTIGDGKPLTLKVQHFWVTESGDTIFSDQAELVAYPAASSVQPLLYSFSYEKGVKITGGTSKFEGATGFLSRVWGGVDLAAGEVVGRYAGTICLKGPGKP